jgi:hypothetical protein
VELVFPLPTLEGGDGPPAGAALAWLHAVYDQGTLIGYVRPAAVYDVLAGTVTLRVPVSALQGTRFVVAAIRPAAVQVLDGDTHLYSGPTEDAADFGVAPAFAEYVVVAPPVAGRLHVCDAATGAYAWIDAARVAPAGPPGMPGMPE